MRALTSLGLLACALVVSAQGFGRFGYATEGVVPGFRLDRNGFAVRQNNADTFWFANPSSIWKPYSTTPLAQTIFLSGRSPAPDKLRQELLSPGFSLHFQNGFRFKVGSLKAPYLSWKDGTLEGDAGYPTPPVKWVLVSFRNDQPAVLLGFLGKPPAVHCWGKTGEWFIGTKDTWEGWIRIAAPFGVKQKRANTVAELGVASQAVGALEPLWTQPAPTVLATKVEEDELGLTVETTYDRPGAIIPSAAILAPLGGTPVSVLSDVTRLDMPTEEGPTTICKGTKLVLRLLAKRIPTGRAIGLGTPPPSASTVSHIDVQGITEFALGNLAAGASKGMSEAVDSIIGQYIAEAVFESEPATRQSMSYSADGKGLDLTAAHALLMQSGIAVRRPSSEENSFFTSLTWRRDPLSWKLWAPDRASARRASALAAIAATLMPEGERRLEGAYLQAGLAAEIGLEVWRKRNSLPYVNTPLLEVLPDILADLYLSPDYRRPKSIVHLLMGPIRAYGVVALQATPVEGGIRLTLKVEPGSTGMFMLTSGFPLTGATVTPADTAVFEESFGMGVVRWTNIKGDTVEVMLSVPSWADELRTYPAEIRWSERMRGPDK